MGFLGGIFRQRRTQYKMNEDEKFYLMSCSDLLGEITGVIDGIGVMHDYFWEKISESKYEKEMRKCGETTKSTLSEAEYIKAPERFKEMHEHLVKGLRYFEDSYRQSLVYLTDKQREHIAKAIELALLGSAELREGNKQWERIKNETRIDK
ncbi:MAG: hypothetical protein WBC40_06360 [Halobacteriota archaeon]